MSLAGAHSLRHGSGRVDLEVLKQTHPVEDVVARYGIELRKHGRALVGRCPLHADGGRPNLHVWPGTASWFCFRCCVGGDIFRFIQLVEDISFREALDRLQNLQVDPAALRRTIPAKSPAPPPSGFDCRDPKEIAMLSAATALYHRRLLSDPSALAYVRGRGLDMLAITDCRIGFAAGNELLAYIRWRSLELAPAMRVGLLDASGRESLAGRVVVPELRSNRPVWLIGRILDADSVESEVGQEPPPKYLGLRESKPLLGAEQVRDSPSVVVCEGVFDYLTARQWGYPSVGLAGTYASRQVLDALRAFPRLYLVMDRDDSGVKATRWLAEELGPSAVPVSLPDGIKDISELAPLPDGRKLFAAALLDAASISRIQSDAG
jgi:DNA primase